MYLPTGGVMAGVVSIGDCDRLKSGFWLNSSIISGDLDRPLWNKLDLFGDLDRSLWNKLEPPFGDFDRSLWNKLLFAGDLDRSLWNELLIGDLDLSLWKKLLLGDLDRFGELDRSIPK